MMMPTSVRLPKDLDERLTRLAEDTGRTKSFYIIEALEREIDRLELVYDFQMQVEDYRAGKLRTYTEEELIAMHGLDLDSDVSTPSSPSSTAHERALRARGLTEEQFDELLSRIPVVNAFPADWYNPDDDVYAEQLSQRTKEDEEEPLTDQEVALQAAGLTQEQWEEAISRIPVVDAFPADWYNPDDDDYAEELRRRSKERRAGPQ